METYFKFSNTNGKIEFSKLFENLGDSNFGS